ncbi:CPNA2-like protein, partial [Mya arenaria]
MADDIHRPHHLLAARLTGEDKEVTDEGTFRTIVDRFNRLDEVTKAIQSVGVDQCGIIFGIDYTTSNETQGKNTFGGNSLHTVKEKTINPYQENDCDGFMEVMDVYNHVTPGLKLGGPTNLAPLIDEAVHIYHILVIATTGQLACQAETVASIVTASNFPLSIIVVGVGDGPWDAMNDFDDLLPERIFDNFQFVNFHKVKQGARNPQASVALAALMEIPDQYMYIKDLKLAKSEVGNLE